MTIDRKPFLSIAAILSLGVVSLFSASVQGDEIRYRVTVKADNQQFTGNVTLEKNIQDHYLSMSFRSSFDKTLPERISFPNLEEVQKSGGLTMSRTEPALYSGNGEQLIRVSEYGAFDDLERKLVELAELPNGLEMKGDSRKYRSAFLLMNEPTAVAWSKTVKNDKGFSVMLNMTDGSQYEFDLDSQKTITSFDILKEDYSLRYSLASAKL
ncbi:hypothetical protein M3P05_01515 [Sansalvadorimonas sp. 2012CJ34-2]|uniref:DUF4412 domain-containing protein n=1 Tax=Parendozoicomonas callyspongiae TaxID=2942213 RepID=A0ABT0PC61_9GAMM|nr:hypothetical protein [Sansalvadorimonas sp. 2012CJ34-2]MCL6268631.1 hypothetical protein [Sansalvadorimonas sp. 2012CJ34-2]